MAQHKSDRPAKPDERDDSRKGEPGDQGIGQREGGTPGAGAGLPPDRDVRGEPTHNPDGTRRMRQHDNPGRDPNNPTHPSHPLNPSAAHDPTSIRHPNRGAHPNNPDYGTGTGFPSEAYETAGTVAEVGTATPQGPHHPTATGAKHGDEDRLEAERREREERDRREDEERKRAAERAGGEGGGSGENR